ncbi:MAG: transcriptional regulator GcvA [Gammaproteobacteria bacterium]|nr:transcriptional regulator GcvA [Gammaproteobacteria bacterium]
MKRLPPLKALQAFEAAGRHLSFSAAAAELHVTPGAISQQVRQLEDSLGMRLFRRLNRAIELTDAGRLILPPVSRGFNQFNDALTLLQQYRSAGPLTITAPASLVSNWLIPRLQRFKADYPDIDVRIDTSNRLVDFIHEDIDVGVRFGDGEYPDLDSTHLFSYELIPVCAPQLMRQGPGLREISDLARYTLLHGDYRDLDAAFPDWTMWLKVVGAEDIEAERGIFFSQADQLFQAVVDGQGVGLLANVMAEPEIAAGRLVQPFAISLPVRMSYHVVTSPAKASWPRVRAFRDWVLAESAGLRTRGRTLSDESGRRD